MTYVVDSVMGEERGEIIRGLARGIYRRYGGVIRVAPGVRPYPGSIVAHLRDLPTKADEVQRELKNVASGLNALKEQTVGLSTSLQTTLQLSQVAAAASVLNLGVSVVGFAVMAYKLDRIQQSVLGLQALAEKNHHEILGRFDKLEHALVELRYIGLDSRSLLVDALSELKNVQSDSVHDHLARVMTELSLLKPSSSDADMANARRTFQQSRRWFHAGVETRRPTRERPDRWFDALLRYRGWCFATIAEVGVLRRMGENLEAAQLARKAATTARGWSEQWLQQLAPRDEFGGVWRFAHSRFQDLPAETFRRLLELQEGDQVSPSDARAVDAAMAVTQLAPELAPDWFDRQREAAAVMDFIAETLARLESTAAEMEHCHRYRLGYAQWEALPPPAEHHGLGVIRVSARA